MKRNTLNALIDAGLAVCMLVLLLTGYAMAFVMPHGGGGGRAVLWGMSRHDMGEIHVWASYVAVGLVVLHLATHWSWVLITARRMVWPEAKGGVSLRAQVVSGAVSLVVLTVFVLGLGMVASASIDHRADGRGGLGPGDGGGRQAGMVEEGERGEDDRQQRRRGAW